MGGFRTHPRVLTRVRSRFFTDSLERGSIDFMTKSLIILLAVCSVAAVAEVVSVYPDKVDFGNTVLTTSSVHFFSLTNPAKKDLHISSISAGGDFWIPWQNCGSILSAGMQCTIAVVFTPTAAGAR